MGVFWNHFLHVSVKIIYWAPNNVPSLRGIAASSFLIQSSCWLPGSHSHSQTFKSVLSQMKRQPKLHSIIREMEKKMAIREPTWDSTVFKTHYGPFAFPVCNPSAWNQQWMDHHCSPESFRPALGRQRHHQPWQSKVLNYGKLSKMHSFQSGQCLKRLRLGCKRFLWSIGNGNDIGGFLRLLAEVQFPGAEQTRLSTLQVLLASLPHVRPAWDLATEVMMSPCYALSIRILLTA